jgi:hypothetical protein
MQLPGDLVAMAEAAVVEAVERSLLAPVVRARAVVVMAAWAIEAAATAATGEVAP